jgi:hypothetical protein
MPKVKDGKFDYDAFPKKEEYLVPVSVAALVKSIRVAHYMKKSFYKVLKDRIRKFYPEISLIHQYLKKILHIKMK